MQKMSLMILFSLLVSGRASAFNVTLTAQAEGGDKPTITGTTNLPDSIELMVSISRKESHYMGQDKVTVKDGRFKTAQFTQKGEAFDPGVYTIEVVMPIASVEPPVTWPIIGNNGSKLEGPLVRKSSFGGKTVEFKTTMVVGSGKASRDKDIKAREKEKRDMHDWWLRSCSDTCKIAQGIALRRSEPFNWDRCYYKCVAEEPAK